MGENCLESVMLMNDVMEDFRCIVSDMMDEGYDYEYALESAWTLVKPAKKKIKIVFSDLIKKKNEHRDRNSRMFVHTHLRK